MKNLVLFFVLNLFLISCGNDAVDNAPKTSVQSSIVDYGNGVYYFNHTSSKFGYALSTFIGTHPELEVVAVSSDGTGGYGTEQGNWVIVSPKIQK